MQYFFFLLRQTVYANLKKRYKMNLQVRLNFDRNVLPIAFSETDTHPQWLT